MKEIPLYKSKLTVKVSDLDYDKILSSISPGCKLHLNTYGYVVGWFIIEGKKLKTSLHRFLLPCNGYEKVDHIDHNLLNNTRENLRVCSYSENARNYNGYRLEYRLDGLKYKGVFYYHGRQRFFSQIKVNKKQIYLGIFNTQEEAAISYNEAAKKYFGEFAKLNVIKESQDNE